MSEFLVLQHIECEDLGTIGPAMSVRGIGAKYIRLFDGEPVPQDIEQYSGLIILGGPMNVYEEDEYPYLKYEDVLIKKAIHKGSPVLGICLGGQLIAKATGAMVKKGAKKEIGWYKLNLTQGGKEDKAFGRLPEEITVFQWHGDTFDIPQGAEHLAGSELFSNQAYRVGNNVYGLQFHLEVTEKTINKWIAEYQDELAALDYIDADQIIKDTSIYINNLSKYAEIFYDKFFPI
ncbi:MAG: gamma-glutamyl-gamma-aminobutyrate hydrolase family protein [Nitrospirae bacterium]|nr:gamma-glutamyl-gamma-aminobutyrate hydrolase family protein [Nitrospirota bacterium]